MADAITIQPQSVPWEPSSADTEFVAEYHRYDIPLIGVVRQAGVEYLFRCILGETGRVSIWLYTILHPLEHEMLDACADEELDSLVAQYSDRPGIMAVAIEGHGVVAAMEVGDRTQDLDAMNSLLDDFSRWLAEMSEQEQATRALIAQ